ncbi:MAG: hypothetical protein A3C43_08215 [Candidatus Schekmanbacteria bacterium RIFCSPHIGHO2_02_FULL_38_11]|uniref:Cyclic nucleotide-binding domain-containing protein n=1 Tax=Candidatus Schekmanbacteria bacterium RIFCSPLOWO2_12_FULL_38_15 TaxID=1817883 RepID=A0A1F7SDG2_9BACT|nr:MAG: hypothetical protein A2043_07490 [Candidatus Schekmanbacteria bacterium GWA2_38_9]OGL49972.1 MAG: hypothetical protein A3H37_12155 [Candidatus Schekmanbacteria bacterium RIFCSPLOWO2_02_FULL_38_14]OGL51810.1 MAG: hypothetical protein A3G31_12560 [Candidatus Schekmanbacteria bacterium RIFCSPLOWO2_12_FULL_38_15]OGL54609.1 MAG: hypothetical protein A3C43_08215 [Candidatus Schekmanbacteria bacterium RIFCSPHIGHO2_02_FULL_38_11]
MPLFGSKEKLKGLINFSKHNPLLKNLTNKEINELEMITHLREYKDGEIIIQSKEPGLAIYIIKKGNAYVVLGSVGGKGEILEKIEEGEVFGEMSLFGNEPRSVHVIADGDAQILGIFKHDFDALIHRNKKLGFKLLYNIAILLSSKLRRANVKLYKKLSDHESTLA